MDSYFNDLQGAVASLHRDQLSGLLHHLKGQRTGGNRLFVCGNGGSHSIAEHWGVDLMKAGSLETHTLGTNPALLTAISNDSDYGLGLSTELRMRAGPLDTVICLSCSGNSRNIVSVMKASIDMRMTRFLITGLKAPEPDRVHVIRAASNDYGVLEDVFSIIGHWLTRELS